LKIQISRMMDKLYTISQYGKDPSGGWSRYSFSDDDLKVRDIMTSWASNLGMAVRTDPAGNWIARLEGNNNKSPVIALGSHIDTVKNGGMFDGSLGMVAAFEVINVITENNLIHNNPIEIISFAEQDGSGFGASLFGSKAMAGVADDVLLQRKNGMGLSLGEAMKRVGCDPQLYRSAQRSKEEIKCYLELHIEQGTILDDAKVSIGIVDGVAGFEWDKVVLKGKSAHAGTIPMTSRVDAVLAAAEIIVAVEKTAKHMNGQIIATVGRCDIQPNTINIVADEAVVYVDIRSIDDRERKSFFSILSKEIEKICEKEKVMYRLEKIAETPSIILDDSLVHRIEDISEKCGYEYRHIISGAGHDVQSMSLITDAAMIFVPSKGGISHSPKELTDASDIEKGANVLLNTIIGLL